MNMYYSVVDGQFCVINQNKAREPRPRKRLSRKG